MKLAAAILASLLACSCSLAMDTVPANWHPSEPPECDSGIGAPVKDLALAVLGAAVHPALAIPGVLSSFKGFYNTSKCSKAQEQHAQWLAGQQHDTAGGQPMANQVLENEPDDDSAEPDDDSAEPDDDSAEPDDDQTPDYYAAQRAGDRPADYYAAQRAALERHREQARQRKQRELEREQRRALERRAWLALSPAERRRWQTLPARARAIVRQRAIARQTSIEDRRAREIWQRGEPERRRRAELERAERAAAERTAAERAAAERAAAERAAAERTAAERTAAEQVAAERTAAEQARRERAEQAAAEQAAAEQARRERAERNDEVARSLEESRRRAEAERERQREAERREQARLQEEARRQRDRDKPPAKTGAIALTGAKPDHGTAAGGDMVTIIGTGFSHLKGKSAEVFFGKQQATIIGLSGDTKLVVETPPGKAGMTVTIRLVLDGQRQLSLVSAFTYE